MSDRKWLSPPPLFKDDFANLTWMTSLMTSSQTSDFLSPVNVLDCALRTVLSFRCKCTAESCPEEEAFIVVMVAGRGSVLSGSESWLNLGQDFKENNWKYPQPTSTIQMIPSNSPEKTWKKTVWFSRRTETLAMRSTENLRTLISTPQTGTQVGCNQNLTT